MTTRIERSSRPWCLAAAAAFGLALLFLAPSAAAQDDGSEGSLTGEFRIGFRTVDVNGAERKYNEDYNIQDGPRLFDLRIGFVPDENTRKLVDRIDINATNLGGDPFESLSISARKFHAYNFRYDRRTSQYFYDDQFLPPELVNARQSSGGDFHTFDFQRVQDRGHLDIDVGSANRFFIGFNRFTRTGDATTTLDQQRDEYELDRKIDETLNDYVAGFEHKWDKVTLSLEENVRQFDNLVSIFLPGRSLGENPDNADAIDFFFLDQPYSLDSNSSTVRIQAQPNDRFLIRAAATVVNLDLDVTASESSQGLTPQGAPFSESATGSGKISQDTDLYDVDLSYQVTDKVAVVGGVRSYSLSQDGDFLFDAALNQGLWDFDTTSVDAGVEVTVSNELTVTGGLVHENRDVKHQDAEAGDPLSEVEKHSTDQDGWYANIGWSPNKQFRLDLGYDNRSINDPFTLASPTDETRMSLRARYKLGNGWSLNGNYIKRSFENGNSGWDADYDKGDIQINYRDKRIDGGVGFGRVDVGRSILQLVSFGTTFDINYDATSDFLTAHLRWKVDEMWSFGGHAQIYDNDGSFALSRDDYGVFGELNLAAYVLRLGYRTIDYNENQFNFDDYDADIFEASVGYRW